MDALQFAYWLQGFAELNEGPPSPEQWQAIRDHLATVFKKVTPNYTTPALPGRPVQDFMPWTIPPAVIDPTPRSPYRTECVARPAGDGCGTVALC